MFNIDAETIFDSDDDESQKGSHFPPLPSKGGGDSTDPAEEKASFDLAMGVETRPSACRAIHDVEGVEGTESCVCSKSVTECKQHVTRRRNKQRGSAGLYRMYPKSTSKNPTTNAPGCRRGGFYPLAEVKKMRGKSDMELRSHSLPQVDSSDSEEDSEENLEAGEIP